MIERAPQEKNAAATRAGLHEVAAFPERATDRDMITQIEQERRENFLQKEKEGKQLHSKKRECSQKLPLGNIGFGIVRCPRVSSALLQFVFVPSTTSHRTYDRPIT